MKVVHSVTELSLSPSLSVCLSVYLGFVLAITAPMSPSASLHPPHGMEWNSDW